TWTGGTAPFYLNQLQDWLPGVPVMDYGFVASEGGFSLPLAPNQKGGVAAVTGHFLEFVPEGAASEGRFNPCLLSGELKVGERYRIIITGSHGLYRYDMNDVVECVGYYQNTAIIAFLHKGGNMISLTGEKMAESHVTVAAKVAEESTGIRLL